MLILGSASPRRAEILSYFQMPFIQKPSSFDEEEVPFQGNPERYVEKIAEGKAKALAPQYPEDLILTCDTTVYYRGEVLNKPKDEADALSMLRRLSGSTHTVYSGLCLRKGTRMWTHIEPTRVTFCSASEEQLRLYHRAIYSHDKAGGYAIQQAGAIIVEKIEGCPYNVMGLPIHGLSRLLDAADISLWQYLKS